MVLKNSLKEVGFSDGCCKLVNYACVSLHICMYVYICIHIHTHTQSFLNVCLVKAMVFPVVMYGCESWTTRKAEHWKIDAFELWCWRRLLRVPWTARRSNQSILKEISPGCSLEGLMLKLKLHYLGHLMWRTDSLEKTLMLGKIEGGRRRGCSNGHEFEQALGSWWWTGKPGVPQSMGLQRVRHDWAVELN